MPQPRGMRDASGLGIRSAADLEPGLFDLAEEIAREAGLDAERALDPLPRLGDDILIEPLAGASLSGRIEMIEPLSAIWKSLIRGFHRG